MECVQPQGHGLTLFANLHKILTCTLHSIIKTCRAKDSQQHTAQTYHSFSQNFLLKLLCTHDNV